MDEEKVTCQICLENYDLSKHDKIPKILPCCGNQIYCLGCLNDIYKKNGNKIRCPVCRQNKELNPENLQTDESVMNNFLKCPNCTKRIIKDDIFFNFEDSKLTCKNCQMNDIFLIDILPNILDDAYLFINSLNNTMLPEEVENNESLLNLFLAKLKSKIDFEFNKIKDDLFKICSDSLVEIFRKKNDFDLKNGANNILDNERKIMDSINTMKEFQKEDSQLTIDKLNNDIHYFCTNFEDYKKNSNIITAIKKKINEFNYFTLNPLIKYEELIKFLNNIYDYSQNEEKKLNNLTGISYYDNSANSYENIKLECQEKIDFYKDMVDKLSEEINNLKNNMANYNTEITNLRNQNDYYIKELTNSKNDNAYYIREITNLKNENNNYIREITNLKNEVNFYRNNGNQGEKKDENMEMFVANDNKFNGEVNNIQEINYFNQNFNVDFNNPEINVFNFFDGYVENKEN